MQRFITDERTGIRYELIGDYYYPCLTVEESSPLSKYGRLRKRYLREHKRVLYYTLLTSGKLYEHLAEIDTSACNMAEYLIKEMARKQGATEELKATDMMRWIGLMNNIRACVDEIVLNDIVYS
ncbi:TnpV protein [Ruminococcus sp.]|uniref:TnpV protein n=1 Tax=Ruminococcus sp. TaxID=41978 RepID=UPI003A981045